MDTVFSVEVAGNETQFTLRELQPNQAYRLRIAAGTGVGFGVPSEWAQHQTLAHYNHSDHSMGKKDTRCGSLNIYKFLKFLFFTLVVMGFFMSWNFEDFWQEYWTCLIMHVY